MRSLVRLALVACAASLALALLAGAASASRSLVIVPEEELVVSTESLTLHTELAEVICRVTLRGALTAASIPKTAGTRLGQFTEGRLTECRESGRGTTSASFLINERERANAVKYASFSGTLPNITATLLNVERLKIQVSVMGGIARCLYEGELGMSVAFPPTEVSRRLVNRVTLLGNRVTLIEGGGLCPRTGEVRGSMTLTPEHWVILDGLPDRAEPSTVEFRGERVNANVTLVASPGMTVRITAIQKVPAERAAGYTIERDDCTGQEIIFGNARDRCVVEIRSNAGAMRANLLWFEGGVIKGIAALNP